MQPKIQKRQKTTTDLWSPPWNSQLPLPLPLDPLTYMIDEIHPCLNQILQEIQDRDAKESREESREIGESEDEEDKEKNQLIDLYTYMTENPHPCALRLMCQMFDDDYSHSDIIWQHEAAEFIVKPFLSRTLNTTHRCRDPKYFLSQNTSDWAINWLERHPHHISWSGLSINPHPTAVDWLKDNSDKIDLYMLQNNENPDAFALFHAHCSCYPISSRYLKMAKNPAAFALLEQRKDELIGNKGCGYDFDEYLCLNPDDRVIEWYNEHPECICWESLCTNPCDAAVRLILKQADQDMHVLDLHIQSLVKNPRREILHLVISRWSAWTWTQDGNQGEYSDHIDNKCMITMNPAIFKGYDYHLHRLFGSKAWDYRPFLKNKMMASGLAEELMANRFHPRNMHLWQGWGHEDDADFS